VSSKPPAHCQHPPNSGAAWPAERVSLLKPSLRTLARNWWPSVVWLGVLCLESTDGASAANTQDLLFRMLAALFPRIPPDVVWQINAILRKTGHFMGYGILGALVFYALRNTNRDRFASLLSRRWGIYLHDVWRSEWAMIGMLVAVITASLDEIHQTFLPSRTGRWQDVVLDGCGAAVLLIIIYFFSLRALNRRRERVAQPEFLSTR